MMSTSFFHRLRHAAATAAKAASPGTAGLAVAANPSEQGSSQSTGLEQRNGGEDRRKPLPESSLERAAREDIARVRVDLAALLNGSAGLRMQMRQLVQIEQAIASKGLAVLPFLPPDVLQAAATQLETLVCHWPAPGLAQLRSKLAVAVIAASQPDCEPEPQPYRTAAVLDRPDRVEVPKPAIPTREQLRALVAAHDAGRQKSLS